MMACPFTLWLYVESIRCLFSLKWLTGDAFTYCDFYNVRYVFLFRRQTFD